MNCARQQDKSIRMVAPFVAAMVVFTFAVAAVPAQAQTFKVLYNAPGGPGISNPDAEATAQGRDGSMYSTSPYGGTDYGTLFKVTPSGKVTVVNNTGVGYFVVSGVTLGADGNLYGTDQDGGPGGDCGFAGCGQIYKVTPAGVETVLYSFTGFDDGSDPHSAPIEGANGTFYGTTPSSNAASISTAYSITSSGKFSTLHTFTNAEGQNVYGGLVQGTDGNFYGVASTQGANGFGTIFKMTPSGTVTVLHSFTNTDGNYPYRPLIQASDGNFYGTTNTGGLGDGVVFKITPSGTYTVLHNLDGNGDGAAPSSSLTQGSDGKLYGVTSDVNASTHGTIFSVTTTGTFKTLYTFSGGTDGNNPNSPLKLNTNGKFYGATYSGGDLSLCSGGGCGVVYSLDVGLKPFVNLVTASGKEGEKIGILGQGFSSASVVEFGGVPATSITLKGTTYISAIVPAGALTGKVTVTTGSTVLTSAQVFRVTPTLLSFSPTSGPVGTPVTITGTGLTQTTKVTFGGMPATTLVVNSDSKVTANVPTGAVTGKIAIKTKGGSAKSKTDFTVN